MFFVFEISHYLTLWINLVFYL